jgi:hypothetical protein
MNVCLGRRYLEEKMCIVFGQVGYILDILLFALVGDHLFQMRVFIGS